jgi:5-methylcytosine-specific restriction endonuclease McrA
MQLPISNNLPVNLLAACFNNTSATYKYYWLLSILQEIEKGNPKVLKKNLFSRMISNAWYTVNYFHVSFGKQDLIQVAIQEINRIEKIDIDENLQSVYQKLSSTSNRDIEQILKHFNKNVPHWFLSPWFQKMDRAEIYKASQEFKENCLYALYDDSIVINPVWVGYLTNNVRVLKDFCYWNLALFLQSKNPNVPYIPSKLIKPATRSALTKQRTQFWDIVIEELGSVNCIYSGEKLIIGNYAVDHFIPYNFVSHDLIWNLIPATPASNREKSDKLPILEKHFNLFYSIQKKAVDIMKVKYPNNKLLEDYLTIFVDLDNSFSKAKYRETIQPLITIASNNGFEFLT